VAPVLKLSRLALSLALASTVAVTGAVIASAYTPPGSALAVTQGCASASQGSSCTVAFELKDANGSPVSDATVSFTVSGVAGASVSPTTGTTTALGDVLAAFSAGNTGCGTATVTASTVTGNSGATVSAQTTINVPCLTSGTLPNTGALPPTTPPWLALIVALALLTVAGGGLALRRMRLTS